MHDSVLGTVLIPSTMKLHVPYRFCIRYVATSVVIGVIILFFYKSYRASDTHNPDPDPDPDPTTLKPVELQICPEMLTPEDGNSTMTPSRSYQLRDICVCPRATVPLSSAVLDEWSRVIFSTCDVEATSRGANQSVVSYMFHGHVTSDDFATIQKTALKVAQMYPGYVMRIYHDLDVLGDVDATKAVCNLWCKHSHLDFCYALHLPYKLCNQEQVSPSLWRFFVLGDRLVDRFLIRDIDSDIIQREVDSVQEWIASGKTWHIMRDNPLHSKPIIPGMWSGTNGDMALTTALRHTFIKEGNSMDTHLDQHLLERILWPIIQDDMVSHDSYLCSHFVGSSPWPSQRPPNLEFVGNKFSWKGLKRNPLNKPCPVECRPKDHQSWTYC